MQTAVELLNDPDIRQTTASEKRRILLQYSTDFGALSPTEQDALLRGASAELRRPPTIGDYAVGALKSVASEALPTLGLIVGGMLGATSGTAGGPLAPLTIPGASVVGAGVGYGLGRQANRVIASMLPEQRGQFVPQPPLGLEAPPVTLGGQIGAIGKDVALGGMMEMLPQSVLLGARGARGPLGISQASPEDLAVRAAAERQGIPLTAGAASASGPVAGLESVPARFPIGRQTVEKPARETLAATQAAAERIRQALGPGRTLEQAGQALQGEIGKIARAQTEAPTALVDAAIDTFRAVQQPVTRGVLGTALKESGATIQTSRREAASRVYDAAIAGRGADEIAVSNMHRAAQAVRQFESRLEGVPSGAARMAAGVERASAPPPITVADLPPEALGELLQKGGQTAQDVLQGTLRPGSFAADFIERYGLHRYGTRTLEEAIAFQQRLGALARKAPDDVTRRQIMSVMDGVSADIAAAAPGTALADAAGYFKREVAVYFARQAPLRKLLNKEPSQVADQILAAKRPERLTEIMTIFPRGNQTLVQQAVLERWKTKATRIDTGEVDPMIFAEQVRAFGDENLGILFGPRRGEVSRLVETMRRNFGPGVSQDALAKILTAQPEQIVNTLARGKLKSLDDFDAVWNVITPATKQDMRSALYTEVLDNSFDPATQLFSMQRFNRQKEMVPQEIWDRMLTGNVGAALRDLELVSQRLVQFNQLAANPSGTASSLLGPAQVMGTIAKGYDITLGALAAGTAGSTAMGYEDPASLAKKTAGLIFLLFAPTMLGKALMSRTGQRMLTSPAPGGGQLPPTTWLESLRRAAPTKTGLITRSVMGAAGSQLE